MAECSWGEGIAVKPDGVHELDPHIYEVAEIHTGVIVAIRRCINCGKQSTAWMQDTEENRAWLESLQ